MQDVTHLLNRTAFGARPGDLERVQKIGGEKYLEEQLHPNSHGGQNLAWAESSSRSHFFSPTCQFTTTFSGGDDAAPAPDVATRKRFPSAVTSYWKETAAIDPAGTMCESNSGTGTPRSNDAVGPEAVFTATAVIFPSTAA